MKRSSSMQDTKHLGDRLRKDFKTVWLAVPGMFLNDNNIKDHALFCEEENLALCFVVPAETTFTFTHLPMDAITHISSYLTLEDLVRCRRLGKYWMEAVAQSDHICFDLDRHAEQKLRFAASQFDALTSIKIRRHYAEDINSYLVRRFILHCSKNIISFSFTGRFCNVRTALQSLGDAVRLQSLKLESCIFDNVH